MKAIWMLPLLLLAAPHGAQAGPAPTAGAQVGARARDSAALPSGRKVYERYVEASGGAAAIARVRSFRVQGSYELITYKLSGTVELHYQRPNRLRMHIDLPSAGQIDRGYDGRTGWFADPQRGRGLAADGELASLQKQAARAFSVLPDVTIYDRIETIERTNFADKDCYRVKLRVKGSVEDYFEYYDVTTGLLVGRIESNASGPEQELLGHVKNYFKVGGLLLPGEWWHQSQGQEWTATYETIELNADVSGRFNVPDDIAAAQK